MGIFLLLLKPLLYLVVLALAARVFARSGPHWGVSSWVTVPLATMARLTLGTVNILLAILLNQQGGSGPTLTPGFVAAIVVFGFVLWLVVARVTFRRAPLAGLLVFCALVETMSAAIDVWAAYDGDHSTGHFI